ncbi:hypothetical protein [Piscirickettsia salmonis]|nr:hypothetical protein [Piscirickettsia salmonis]
MSESTIYRYIHEDREKGGELYKSLPHSGKPYKKNVSVATSVGILHIQ